MGDKIGRFIWRVPAKNIVTGDTLKQRMREQYCRVLGCIGLGELTGLPQAQCMRCGHKNKCAAAFIKEWSNPND